MSREEHFTTPGPLALHLRVPGGDVQIATHDLRETLVVVEPHGDEVGERAAADARVELRDRAAGGHELHVEIPELRDGGLLGRAPDVRVRVACPHGADLYLTSKTADLAARGRLGSVDVESASGDVRIDEVGGSARVQAVSGDVRIGRVAASAELSAVSGDCHLDAVGGAATVNTVSGDLRLGQAGSSVSANSVSGDQWLGDVREGAVTLHSVSGDIHVGVRRGSRVRIDAASRSGELVSELELRDTRPEGDGPFLELTAQTQSGDVEVVRAPAVPPVSPAASRTELEA